jgi:hypothetical protein
MGLKDSLVKKAAFVPVAIASEELIVNSLTEALTSAIVQRKIELRPKLTFVPSKNKKLTAEPFNCEACGKLDICTEIGKLLLCDSCSEKELEIIKQEGNTLKDTTKDNGVWSASINNLNPEVVEQDAPLYAKGREDKYFEFFNRSYDIDKMTDEELRDSIIADGDILFEVKVRQQKKVIRLNERAAKKTAEERKKLRLDDLTYNPEQKIELEKERKAPRDKKQQGEDALKSLGLDVALFMKKFKVEK